MILLVYIFLRSLKYCRHSVGIIKWLWDTGSQKPVAFGPNVAASPICLPERPCPFLLPTPLLLLTKFSMMLLEQHFHPLSPWSEKWRGHLACRADLFYQTNPKTQKKPHQEAARLCGSSSKEIAADARGPERGAWALQPGDLIVHPDLATNSYGTCQTGHLAESQFPHL